MSNLVITKAGIAAAIRAGQGGPRIKITNFKVSSRAGFKPLDTDTSLQSVVYEGSVNVAQSLTYSIANNDSIIYRVTLDEQVGNFDVGSIGLYTEDGTLFAIAALAVAAPKVRANFPTTVGNRKVYDLMLILSNIATISDLTFLLANETSLARVRTEADLPDATVAPYNAYIVHTHSQYGMPATAIAVEGAWYFALHFRRDPAELFNIRRQMLYYGQQG